MPWVPQPCRIHLHLPGGCPPHSIPSSILCQPQQRVLEGLTHWSRRDVVLSPSLSPTGRDTRLPPLLTTGGHPETSLGTLTLALGLEHSPCGWALNGTLRSGALGTGGHGHQSCPLNEQPGYPRRRLWRPPGPFHPYPAAFSLGTGDCGNPSSGTP